MTPRMAWPGAVEVTLRSGCSVWVVYDQDPGSSASSPRPTSPMPSDRDPAVLEPGDQLAASLEIGWSRSSRIVAWRRELASRHGSTSSDGFRADAIDRDGEGR